MEFVDLKTQYSKIEVPLNKRLTKVFNSGRFILGDEVFELEDRLSDYVGVDYAITCANGTDALVLSLMALGVSKGDAVFCPTFTFFATAESIALVGANPIFVDSEPNTYNICPNDLRKKIQQTYQQATFKPKAIIAVDLFGLPADYSLLTQIALENNLYLIEDGAQSFGGVLNDLHTGSFGHLATTSFFPAKPLGCYGDGGAIFTDSEELAVLLKSLRVHGQGQNKYENVRVGKNSRLDTIQAAVLLEKLKLFPEELILRQNISEYYSSQLKNQNCHTPLVPNNSKSAWAQYTIVVDQRDEVVEQLNSKGIPTMVYYRNCMHQQKAFSASNANCPIAEKLSKSVLSLPIHPYLNGDEEKIVCRLNQVLDAISCN